MLGSVRGARREPRPYRDWPLKVDAQFRDDPDDQHQVQSEGTTRPAFVKNREVRVPLVGPGRSSPEISHSVAVRTMSCFETCAAAESSPYKRLSELSTTATFGDWFSFLLPTLTALSWASVSISCRNREDACKYRPSAIAFSQASIPITNEAKRALRSSLIGLVLPLSRSRAAASAPVAPYSTKQPHFTARCPRFRHSFRNNGPAFARSAAAVPA